MVIPTRGGEEGGGAHARPFCSQSRGWDGRPERKSALQCLTLERRGEARTTGAEVRQEGSRGREEPLGRTRGLDPLPAALPLPGRRGRVCCALRERAGRARCHARPDVARRRSLARQFIGDEHAGHGRAPFAELADELLGRFLVPAAGPRDPGRSRLALRPAPESAARPCGSERPRREALCPWAEAGAAGADGHRLGQTSGTTCESLRK